MAEEAPATIAAPGAGQLIQVRVPLDDAADAFAVRDATGRTPIVVLTTRQHRIRNDFMVLALVVLVGGWIAGSLFDSFLIPTIAIPIAIVLALLGVWRIFYVVIPEGTSALLTRGGKYSRTIGSGSYWLPPYMIVSHVVTRREIPYDVPVLEAPTADDVRAAVDVLVTFRINDPYKFVYAISADDFDLVLQAACQDVLRSLVRRTHSSEIANLTGQDSADLSAALNQSVEAYGVTIGRVTITYARPPESFLRSQEARQLAVVQRAEQEETQALALRRLADEEELARQRVVAHVAREREALQMDVQQAEVRRRVAELDAAAEELRLARLEERLAKYPRAAQWEWDGVQLEVARALAGNSRVLLQANGSDDLARLVMLRELAAEQPQANGGGYPEPAQEPQEASRARGDPPAPQVQSQRSRRSAQKSEET
jgi:regulator of protease activity HflC (stomatin/prohibitin superfamily)